MTEKERRELEEQEAEAARQDELETRGGFHFTFAEIVVFLSAYTIVLSKLDETLGTYTDAKGHIIWPLLGKTVGGILAVVALCSLAAGVMCYLFRSFPEKAIFKMEKGPARFFVEIALVIAAVGAVLWLVTLWH